MTIYTPDSITGTALNNNNVFSFYLNCYDATSCNSNTVYSQLGLNNEFVYACNDNIPAQCNNNNNIYCGTNNNDICQMLFKKNQWICNDIQGKCYFSDGRVLQAKFLAYGTAAFWVLFIVLLLGGITLIFICIKSTRMKYNQYRIDKLRSHRRRQSSLLYKSKKDRELRAKQLSRQQTRGNVLFNDKVDRIRADSTHDSITTSHNNIIIPEYEPSISKSKSKSVHSVKKLKDGSKKHNKKSKKKTNQKNKRAKSVDHTANKKKIKKLAQNKRYINVSQYIINILSEHI